MTENLKDFLEELKQFRKDIKAEDVTQIGKKTLRSRADSIGAKWFSEFRQRLEGEYGFGKRNCR